VGIYDCTITDWGTVGGTPGSIQRYFPQAGSGTRSFFNTDVLGKASGYTPPNAAGIAGCPSDPIFVEENEAQQIVAADNDKAIFPYSAGVYAFQVNNNVNPTLDRRLPANCIGCEKAKLGGLSTAGVTTSTVVGNPLLWSAIDTTYQLDPTLVHESFVSANTNFFPHQFLGAACAAWSVKTAVAFLNGFYERIGIESRLKPFMEQFDGL